MIIPSEVIKIDRYHDKSMLTVFEEKRNALKVSRQNGVLATATIIVQLITV